MICSNLATNLDGVVPTQIFKGSQVLVAILGIELKTSCIQCGF